MRAFILLLGSLSCLTPLWAAADKAENFKTIVEHFESKLGYNGVVLIAKGDEILFSSGLGYANLELKTPVTIDTPFRLASLTKQFTARVTVSALKKPSLNREAL